jgi:hypothetical protein
MELVKRQVVELAKITHLEEKQLQVQEERVGRIQLAAEKE